MASITEIAEQFFVACDEGKGWEGCKEFCKPDATFSVQAEPLADMAGEKKERMASGRGISWTISQ